ncbi:MAG: endonuclease/exonuclease/phosphatase family protein [Sulfurimonadaceae bacterium]|nr:endonuclease/exonuclease/phosphatase family protein [Sulfurimonadaceae bacterium]
MHIGSYNVENLFDLVHDGNEYEEYIPNTATKWNKKNYTIKLKNLSKVIKDLDVDILALQEIESLEALKDLRFELQQQGIYYQYYSIADKKKTSVKVALLSKYPFVYAKEVAVTSSLSQRNILEVKYKIDKREFYLFINHWRAKSKPESYRITSARELIKRIKQIGLDKNIIIMGDFNSDYEENIKFLRKREHNDTNGKTAINDVLKTKDQKKKAKDTKYSDKSFYNLWYDTDEENRYTYIFRGNKEVLDNIIISQALLNPKEMYYKSSTITHLDKPYLFHKKQIYRWQMSKKIPKKHLGKGYSDHLPIKAQFIID